MAHVKPQPDPTGLKINVIAVGGRGCNTLQRLADLEKKGARLAAIAPAGKLFNSLQVPTKIEIPSSNEAHLEKRSLEELESLATAGIGGKSEEIKELVDGSNIVFLLGNISNTLNTLNAIKIAEIAREAGALTIYVGVHPFAFEGAEAGKAAEANQGMLRKALDGVLVLDYEKGATSESTAEEALTIVDRTIASWISELVELVERVGVVNVDFNDFRTTIARGGDLFFNVAEGKTDQIPLLLDKLFSDAPYHGAVREKLERAIYVVTGGSGMSIATTEAIGKGIALRLEENARVIFGVVVDPTKGDSIKVSLIAAPKGYM